MPRDRDDRFGRQALALREQARLTQGDVAAAVGISERSIQFWESGEAFPTPENLKRLCALYLAHGAFKAGDEQSEAAAFWERYVASASRRKAPFDQAWFRDLLAQQRQRGIPPPGVLPGPGAPGQPSGADWGSAPGAAAFHGREAELATLERWVGTERCQVITITGMGGVGKTTLAARFARRAASGFAYVFWRSLHNAPPLDEIVADCVQLLSGGRLSAAQDTGHGRSVVTLLRLLAQQRCLLVLDNLETLLQPGSLHGGFRDGYAAYGRFIQQLAESPHQSCVLLTSREQLRELAPLEGPGAPARTLRLVGLAPEAGRALLTQSDLRGSPASWDRFLETYGSNTLALKLAATTVRDLFDGDLDRFAHSASLPLHSLLQLLDDQFARVAPLERDLLLWLAIERAPVTLETLSSDLGAAARRQDVLLALTSLRRRSLVERLEGEGTLTLQPVVMEYLTERLVTQISEEILQVRPDLLTRYALLKLQSPDYLRESQIRMLVQPVCDHLLAHFGDRRWVENQLLRLVAGMRGLPPAAQGYGGGNLVNLLVSLRGDLNGLDLSGIVLRQAFLNGVAAQGASFARVDAREALFTTPLETIASMALSPDGAYLAVGSFGGQVQVWQAADGKLLWATKAHSRMTWALAFHPSGELLASGGYQGRLRLWDVRSGRQVVAWQAHDGWVRAIAFSPDGERIASAGDDAVVHIWEYRTQTALQVLSGHQGIIWSVAFNRASSCVISGGADGTIRAWDVASGAARYTIQEAAGVFAVAAHPAGTYYASGDTDGRIRLWDVERGALIGQLPRRAHGLATLAFNPEGTALACGSLEGAVELWAMDEAGVVGYAGLLEGHQWMVSAVSFAAGKLLASTAYGGQVKLWDTQRGQLLRTVQGYSRLATALAFSPDGRLLANGDDKGMLRLWDVASGRCLMAFAGHSGPVWTIAWKPDGAAFASGGDDREVKIWDVASGQCLQRLRGNNVVLWSIVFREDGAVLASAGGDNMIRLYRTEAGGASEPFATIEGTSSNMVSLAFRQDGAMLASGHLHGEVVLWELANNTPVSTLQHGSGPVGALTFCGTDRLLSSSNDQLLRQWDLPGGRCLDRWPGRAAGNWFKAVALSPDGSLVATGSGGTSVQLWRPAPAHDGVERTELRGHSGQIWAIALSDDRQLLAGADHLGTILIWDLRSGEVRHCLRTDRPYEQLDISGMQGLSAAQRAALRALGAVEAAGE